MKTYCLVCKNYTNNNNSRVVKNKQRLLLKSNCSVVEIKKNMFTSKGSGLSDCNGTRTHNHLIRKRTLNYLAKLAK